MALLRKVAPVLLMSLAFVLAGCTDGGGEGTGAGAGGDAPPVEATSTTGGIRGVVVDERITPIKGALIEITGTNKNVTTSEDGLFSVSGLEAGTYFLRASHPLYSSMQQSVDVVAGEENPPSQKILLQRTIFAQPYMETLSFDGFIACSQDFDGSLFSEECGEGAGVPCAVPVAGCQRIGRQAGNKVQFDFYPSANSVQSLIVELSWEPTIGAATTGALWTVVATEFVCDPFCGGENVMNYDNEHFGNCATTPSYIRQNENLAKLNLTTETKISTFTWACGKGGTVPYDIQVNQKFQEFVTMSYYLPLPEGWSFVAGDPDPFK